MDGQPRVDVTVRYGAPQQPVGVHRGEGSARLEGVATSVTLVSRGIDS
jgi:hypothetical protein